MQVHSGSFFGLHGSPRSLRYADSSICSPAQNWHGLDGQQWASARVDGSNNSSGGNTSQVPNIYLSGKFIPYPGNAVQDLDLSLLTGSQSMKHGSFPCGNLDSQLAVPLCLEANAENLQRIYLHFLFSHSVVLDLTGRSARLCEFDLCKPPIRKRHNLPTSKDVPWILPDWIVLPSTCLHRLGLKNCRITDESIMATFPKGVSALQMRLLDLSGCKFLSDDAVDRIAAACPMLQRLSLDRCVRITDCAVAALSVAPLAKTLMFLTLSNCNRVSLGGLLCLHRCLALTFLDLSQMASIPSHQLLALFRPDGDLRHVTTFKT
ncbi:hypothetical protein BASA61_001875 [Batrachochytrium salamandrivorans]|nr:hypothetical protein BASA61_001875 [Batrachochytrium salamandrivorans]